MTMHERHHICKKQNKTCLNLLFQLYYIVVVHLLKPLKVFIVMSLSGLLPRNNPIFYFLFPGFLYLFKIRQSPHL